MKSTLTWLRQYASVGCVALGLLAASAGAAQAGNVGISVGIHVPGVPVYVTPPPPPPPPRPHYYRASPPPVVYYAPPAYRGHWAPPPPPRHAKGKHFKHHRSHPSHRHPHHHR